MSATNGCEDKVFVCGGENVLIRELAAEVLGLNFLIRWPLFINVM